MQSFKYIIFLLSLTFINGNIYLRRTSENVITPVPDVNISIPDINNTTPCWVNITIPGVLNISTPCM